MNNITVLSGESSSRIVVREESMSVYGMVGSISVYLNGVLYIFSGGTANSTTVSDSGYMHVYSGGVANFTTVDSSGYMYVASGGVLNSTTMGGSAYGGIMHVSGGVLNSTTMSGGTMYVASGGVLNSTTMSGGNLRISNGGVVNVAAVTRGITYIDSGGVANSITMNGGGMYVSSGGVANSITVCGGRLCIFNGGTALAIRENGGYVEIASGARVAFVPNSFSGLTLLSNSATLHSGTTANCTIVNRSGRIYISSGGVANSTIMSGGTMYVANGGVMSSTIMIGGQIHVSRGGTANATITSGGNVYVSGGVLNSTTISRGYINISSGGVANATIMNGGNVYVSGGVLNSTTMSGVIMHISGGILSSTIMIGGQIHLSSGGTANATVMRGGNVYVSGGVLNSITMSGVIMHISSCGVANSITMIGDGTMYVSCGGIVNSTTVYSSGDIYVSSGGTALAIKENGGYVEVASGAQVTFVSNSFSGLVLSYASATLHSGTTANSTIMSVGGMHVFSGGVANFTTMSGGGMRVFSGGAANFTTMSDGTMRVSCGGMVNSITVYSSGDIYVSSGGTALAIKENGGYVETASGATVTFVSNSFSRLVLSYESATLHSGTTANSITVTKSGHIYVNGGVANRTIIDSNGYMFVSSGGKVNNTTVDSYGCIFVAIDGVANGVYITNHGSMYVLNGGTASSVSLDGRHTAVYSAGIMYVLNGGIADSTTLYRGGYMYAYNCGIVNSTTVNYWGHMYVSNGGVAKYTIVNSEGRIDVLNGGIVNSSTVNLCGDMVISSGGIANATMVNNSGWLWVDNGGMANSTIMSLGVMNVFGVANFTTMSGGGMHVFNGGMVNSITVYSSGGIYVSSGGTALAIKENGGYVEVASGAQVTFVSNSFSGLVLLSNSATLHSGTTANSTTVSSRGHMFIYRGGVANTTTVKRDGYMYISSGGKHTGTLTIADGANVYAFTGGIVELNISNIAPGNSALINNLSRINGSPDYVITISATQLSGEYRLADSAADFGQTITVNTEDGVRLGTLSVDAEFTYDDCTYKLRKNSDTLLLTITGPPPPTVNASTIEPTNDKVTITATFSTEIVKKEYSTDNKTWKGYADTLSVSENGSYYFRGISKGGRVSEVSCYTVTNIDRIAPSAPIAATNTIAPINPAVTAPIHGKTINIEGCIDGEGIFVFQDNKITYKNFNYSYPNNVTINGVNWSNLNIPFDLDFNVNCSSTKLTKKIGRNSNTITLTPYDNRLELYIYDSDSGSAQYSVSLICDSFSRNVTVTATFSDDSVIKQYSLDEETWQDYTTGVVMTDNGTVYFRGIDAAGNISDVTEYVVTNIDKIAPNAPTVAASTTKLTNQNVTVTATFSEDSVVKQYSTDNKTWKNYSAALSVGKNATYYFRGGDAAGNISEVTTIKVANIDKVAPTVKLSTTAPTNKNVTITATFTKDAAKKQYSTDKKTWQTYSKALTATKNATYYFRGIDKNGKASTVVTLKVTNIDKTAPKAPTVKLSTTQATNQNVTVTATFSKDSAKKQYSTDNKTWKTYSKALSIGKNGTYYFRGVDAAGNVSEAASIKVANIDKTAPAAPTVKVSTTKATNKSITVTATFSKDSTKKQYSTDNKTWKTYGKSLSVGKNGTYYFRGIDAAGNVSKVKSVKIANIVDTANNNWNGATVLKKTVLGALEAKADKVDYYDVSDVAQLMLDMEKGKAKVSFYDANKKAVKVAGLTMADGSVRKNVSSLTLATGNAAADNFTIAALDECVKYLKIETADKTLDSYKLAKLA